MEEFNKTTENQKIEENLQDLPNKTVITSFYPLSEEELKAAANNGTAPTEGIAEPGSDYIGAEEDDKVIIPSSLIPPTEGKVESVEEQIDFSNDPEIAKLESMKLTMEITMQEKKKKLDYITKLLADIKELQQTIDAYDANISAAYAQIDSYGQSKTVK